MLCLQKLALARLRSDVNYDVVHFWSLCKEYLTLFFKKNCWLLFSAVISEHFSKNRMIMSFCNGCKNMVSQKCTVFLAHPVFLMHFVCRVASVLMS